MLSFYRAVLYGTCLEISHFMFLRESRLYEFGTTRGSENEQFSYLIDGSLNMHDIGVTW